MHYHTNSTIPQPTLTHNPHTKFQRNRTIRDEVILIKICLILSPSAVLDSIGSGLRGPIIHQCIKLQSVDVLTARSWRSSAALGRLTAAAGGCEDACCWCWWCCWGRDDNIICCITNWCICAFCSISISITSAPQTRSCFYFVYVCMKLYPYSAGSPSLLSTLSLSLVSVAESIQSSELWNYLAKMCYASCIPTAFLHETIYQRLHMQTLFKSMSNSHGIEI